VLGRAAVKPTATLFRTGEVSLPSLAARRSR